MINDNYFYLPYDFKTTLLEDTVLYPAGTIRGLAWPRGQRFGLKLDAEMSDTMIENTVKEKLNQYGWTIFEYEMLEHNNRAIKIRVTVSYNNTYRETFVLDFAPEHNPLNDVEVYGRNMM